MTTVVVPIPTAPGVLPPVVRPAPAASAPTTAGGAAGGAASGQPSATGLGFERILLTELTRTLTESSGLTSGAAKILSAQLPDVLADALAAGGGIGLAAALAPVPGHEVTP